MNVCICDVQYMISIVYIKVKYSCVLLKNVLLCSLISLIFYVISVCPRIVWGVGWVGVVNVSMFA